MVDPASQPVKARVPQSEEILDVVDDADRVVECLTRGEIHQRALMHRSVHLLVFDGRGRVFLQKRSQLKDNNPGLWDSSVSGHVDSGEDYDTCVIREAAEEIGLVLCQVPERLFKLDACVDTGWEFTWIFRCSSEGPFSLDPAEIETGDWFTTDDVDAWVQRRPAELANSLRLIWREYRSRYPA